MDSTFVFDGIGEDGYRRSFAALKGQASGGIGPGKWETSGLWGRNFGGLAGGSPAFSQTTYPDARGVTRATLSGKRLAYAGAIGGTVATAATVAALIARNRRLRPAG